MTRIAGDGEARRLANRTMARLGRLMLRTGDLKGLDALIAEAGNRNLEGGAWLPQWLHVRELREVLRRDPDRGAGCGIRALHAMCMTLRSEAYQPSLVLSRSQALVSSLASLTELARQAGVALTPAERTAGTDLPLPGIVHWSWHHFGAIVGRYGQEYLVFDPMDGSTRSYTAEAINAETSGRFLLAHSLPPGWRRLSSVEAEQTIGRLVWYGDEKDQPCPNGTCDCPPANNSDGGSESDEGGGSAGADDGSLESLCDGCSQPLDYISALEGMTTWFVSEPYLNLWLHDTPFGYRPSIGPAVRLKLSYKQREEDQDADLAGFTTFGLQWNASWISYVKVLSDNTVRAYLPGGGVSDFQYASENDDIVSIYVNNLRGQRTRNQSGQLTKFEIPHGDGSRDVYETTSPHHPGFLFLSRRIDPHGQELTFAYANTGNAFHLISVQDADSKTCTLSYVSGTDRVASVTDYAQRVANFGYTIVGDAVRLTSITDVELIVSSIVYDAETGWPRTLTTPYGTTTFTLRDMSQPSGQATFVVNRFALIDEPEGARKVFVRVDAAAPGMDTAYLPSVTPQDASGTTWGTLDDSERNLRNSFRWNRRQTSFLGLATDPDDVDPDLFDWAKFKQARIRHWLGANGVDTLSVQQEPSPDGTIEGQITWFDHAGKLARTSRGAQILPSLIVQVIPGRPNTEPRYVQYERQAEYGKATSESRSWTQPDGSLGTRTRCFSYADNKTDLEAITDYSGAIVRFFTYDPNDLHYVLTDNLAPADGVIYTTTYTYSAGRLLTITSPLGLVRTFSYGADGYVSGFTDQPTGRTESFTWLNGYPRTHTDARGLTRTLTYDKLGRLVRRDFNTSPATFEEFRYTKDGTAGGPPWLSLTYYRDARGKVTRHTYNLLGQRTSTTDALQHTTTFERCSCGVLESIENALHQFATFDYDHRGLRTSTTYHDNTSISQGYNLLGQLTNVGDAVGSRTFTYNNQGRLTQVQTPEGRVFGAVYDAENRPTTQTNANGVVLSQTYDRLGRVLTRTFPDTGVERFGYGPAGVLSYTNQLGKITRYVYDTAGRLTAEIDANLKTNLYGYSAAGDLVSLTHGGNTTTWGYDMFGRVNFKTNALNSRILAYTYDEVGHLKTRTSAAKGTTTYGYDDVGNLLSVNYPISPDVAFTYDAVNRLATMTDAVGPTTFHYDAGGNLDYEDGPWATDRVTYVHHASAPHLRTGFTLQQPAGTWTQTWNYDGAHRIETLASPAGEFGYAYLPGVVGSGQATRLVQVLFLPNLATIVNDFDTSGRQTWTLLYNEAQTLLNAHGYSYNAGWQRTFHVRTDSSHVALGYDNIGQLQSAVGSGGLSTENLGYLYDAAWNLRGRTNNGVVLPFGVNSLNHLTSGPKPAYGYDSNGNLRVESSGRVFTCDDENQLVQVYQSGQYLQGFDYDGLGRMRKCTNYTWTGAWTVTGETRYLYDGRRVIQERNSANVPTVTYTRGTDLSGTFEGAGGIGGLLARSHGYSGGSWATHSLYHADVGGNVTKLIDAGNHAVKATYKYDPYGNTLTADGDLAAANVYRFSSKEWHASSGLYYYGFRFYEPNLQRWLNRDPIGERGGVNMHRFVNNSPLNLIDRSGLDIWIGTDGFHQNINVGTPGGESSSYSFGLDSSWSILNPWRDGVIYVDDRPNPLSPSYGYLKTTPEEDESAKSILDQMVNERMRYGLPYGNCRTFSQAMLDFFKDQFPDRYVPPQLPPPPPPDGRYFFP